MTPEAKVKKEIREYIDALPQTARLSPRQSGYGMNGIPDEIICHKGLFFAVEVKAPPYGFTTPWQDQCLFALRKAGGVAGVCWCLGDVKKLFEQGIAHFPTAVGSKKYEIIYYQH